MTLEELYALIGEDYEQAMKVLRKEKLLDRYVRRLPDNELCAALAEKGGQSADIGTLELPDGSIFEVTNVLISKGDKYLHHGVCRKGAFHTEDSVLAKVNVPYRQAIMRAHSATHLLQAALRKVLGDHVQQAGSLVLADQLRFDFTHYEAITEEQLRQVEALVNEEVLDDLPVTVKEDKTREVIGIYNKPTESAHGWCLMLF